MTIQKPSFQAQINSSMCDLSFSHDEVVKKRTSFHSFLLWLEMTKAVFIQKCLPVSKVDSYWNWVSKKMRCETPSTQCKRVQSCMYAHFIAQRVTLYQCSSIWYRCRIIRVRVLISKVEKLEVWTYPYSAVQVHANATWIS